MRGQRIVDNRHHLIMPPHLSRARTSSTYVTSLADVIDVWLLDDFVMLPT